MVSLTTGAEGPLLVSSRSDDPMAQDWLRRQHVLYIPGVIVAPLRPAVSWLPHVWLAVLAGSVIACGSDTPTGPSATPTAIAVTCTATTAGHDCRASLQRSSGATQDVTTTATWTSSNTAVATVDAGGHVIHRGTGQTEIRATFQDLFGGSIILVNLSVTSVSVACVPDGVNYACTAIANFSNSTTLDVTRSGTAWSSSNTAVATVDSAGRVTPVANGQAEISARFQSTVGGVTLTLSGVATLTTISVTCTAQTEAHQCAAVANRSDGTTIQVTSQALWTSSNTGVATVDQSGFVRHRATGQVDIRATYQNVTGSRSLDIVVGFGTSVVINEFGTRGPDESTDDFVELRNDTASPVDISGWRINEWRPTSGVQTQFVVPNGIVLAPGCHYLVANRPSVAGVVPDAQLINPINDQGGLALQHANGSLVDQVGYHPDSIYREGTPMPLPGNEDSRSYARVGNDTNNNISDFARQSRTPLSSGSSCAVR